MKKTTPTIRTFNEYLEFHCTSQQVSVQQAEEYAQKGKQFLEAVMSGREESYPSKKKSDNVAFLHWYLLRESFNQEMPFSKGMFNLEGKDDASTKKLYHYLKGEAQSDNSPLPVKILKGIVGDSAANKDLAYSRPSTHYNDYLVDDYKKSFGIDQVNIPLAWKFTTHTFGLMKNPDNSLSVFFKPETQSMDVNKTKESFLHGLNLVKKIIYPQKLKGMERTFREDSIDIETKEFVKESLRKENLLTKDIDKKIDRCNHMEDLAKIINMTQSAMDFTPHLLEQYGTTNQIGSELRFKIADEGSLTIMRNEPQLDFSQEKLVSKVYPDDEEGPWGFGDESPTNITTSFFKENIKLMHDHEKHLAEVPQKPVLGS